MSLQSLTRSPFILEERRDTLNFLGGPKPQPSVSEGSQPHLQLPLDSDEVKEALVSIRAAFGLTTKDLADVLRVERQTIYAWIRGENEPRDENSRRIRLLTMLADEWSTLSGLPAKKLLRIEWENGLTLWGGLCCEPLDLGKIRSMMQRGAELVNARKRPAVEQILIDNGLDPARYRVSDAEFDAATGKAHFPTEDWE